MCIRDRNNGTLTIYIIGTAQDKPKNVSISVGDYGEIPNKTITKGDPSWKEKEVQEVHVGLTTVSYTHLKVLGSCYDSFYNWRQPLLDTINSIKVEVNDLVKYDSELKEVSEMVDSARCV